MLYAAGLPENKSLEIVDHEYFTLGDLSAAAQMEKIKVAKPDVLVIWATGAPAGTIFRSSQDLNIDLHRPSRRRGNLNAAFFKQYGPRLPTSVYFASVPYYAGDALDGATKSAVATLTNALASVGAKPDMIQISAWDPGMILVDALRKVGH